MPNLQWNKGVWEPRLGTPLKQLLEEAQSIADRNEEIVTFVQNGVKFIVDRNSSLPQLYWDWLECSAGDTLGP